jgi:hypothetical protein
MVFKLLHSIMISRKQPLEDVVFLICAFFVKSLFSGLTSLKMNLRVEADSLRHLSAKYCPLLPAPRSTIAAAFSPDGKVLASTQ